MTNLNVEVHDNSITVTMPATEFSVTYERRPDCEHVVFAKTWLPPDAITPDLATFRSLAFRLALAKARELGWIV